MAYVDEGFKTFVAGGALAAHTAVKLDANGNAVTATAATDKAIGVVHTAIASGAPASVRLRSAAGTANIVCGAAVTAGAYILADAAGKATTAGSGTAGALTAGDQILGQALGAGAVGEIIEFIPAVLKV